METPDVNKAAEPSTAAPTHFDSWDENGNPVVSKKAEPVQESAPADAPKVETPEPKGESAAESGTAKPKQEKRGGKLSADERINQLIADNKRLLSELETERTRPREPAPKPAEPKAEAKPAQPATYDDWRKTFNAQKWVEKYQEDHQGVSYEDSVAALSDHLDGIRQGYRQQAEQLKAISDRVTHQFEEAKKLYPDFQEKAKPILEALSTDKSIHPVFKEALGNSPVFPHLAYALSHEQSKALMETAKTNVVLALKQLGVLEDAVMKELNKSKEPKAEAKPEVDDKPKTPAKEPKPRAPHPPDEAGGRSAAAQDELVAAAAANDFSRFDAEQRRRMLARAR